MAHTSRTVLMIGTAMAAGGLMDGVAFGQAAAPGRTALPHPGGSDEYE